MDRNVPKTDHMSDRPPRRRRGAAAVGSALLLAAGALVAMGAQAAPAATAPGSTASTASTASAAAADTVTGGSGAGLPYSEVQAEDADTDGTEIGPSYTQGKLADEASYRKAVTLKGSGQYVTFTTPVATNSIDIRYSIPDSSDGSAYTAPLHLSIDGAQQSDLQLTNAYSWFYGSYPFTNTPGGNPHHFFDEVHRLLPTTYPKGTTFKLAVPASGAASSYTIDLADFEQVAAPATQPSGSVSVVDKGADPTGKSDSTAAFNAAISAAGPGGTVWIPKGTFKVPGHIAVNDVTVAGAGMWYSTVTGAAPGFYGNSAPNPSTKVHLKNFAISGDVRERNDNAQVNGVGGAMSDSTVDHLWIEHMKVGAWMDGPMDGLTFSGMRIRDTTADGINFHGGVTHSKVTGSDIRNTGDDGIATWADSSIGADSDDTISDNTVQLQMLANGIALYGGHDNTVSGNLVRDTGITQGGGIHVGQRFTSTPVGRTTISGNTIVRAGSLDPHWNFGVGALWFDASQGAINGPVDVSNTLIQQSPYEAVQWVEGTVSGVSLKDVKIDGTGTFALQEQTGGAATLSNVTATGVNGPAPVYSCEGGNFKVTDGGGNSGIGGTPYCGGWPDPVYPPYPGGTSTPPAQVSVAPGSLDFGDVKTGSTSSAKTVTVSNPTDAAVAVGTVAASGDFAQTNTCGSSVAAGGSCAVKVTFSPTATGARTGTLTVPVAGSDHTVSLSGNGVSATTNLAAGRPATASSSKYPYTAGNITDSDASTYWESTNGSFPQWAQVDLGANHSVGKVVLRLPPSTAWNTRTETLSVLGSTDGSTFSTLLPSAGHTFDPAANNNTVTLTFPAATARYVRIHITANTGWNAGQLSDLAVYSAS
ncbi:discoidin domain-containing protein [Streptomyces beihaiensis]|uniref:Discoidin domain-containing protein n=1 Tax=Streptomyces beihaiensis TaxID=2984495 RepID=A0ABT3TWV2_9ACTN|nr:discoidin domain-containing protein [Streptomyces beihaiensis]MCX3061524.1 discoidin domain-containing protein [Streptomyces beihaiensis]